MTTNRAYSVIEIKALDENKRTFTGWATTPDVDRVNDTINPLGAKFTNPVVLLHQHDHDKPVGLVKFKKPTKAGIEFEAEIPVIDEPGPLKDRVDTAWGELKAGLVRAVSIGFRSLKYSYKDNGGIDFEETEIFELSTVSIPANSAAIITSVSKGMDVSAASIIKTYDVGAEPAVNEIPATTPAATGTKRVVKLATPARDRAPFQIRSIVRTKH